jgi:PAS domain S-box-containing protein
MRETMSTRFTDDNLQIYVYTADARLQRAEVLAISAGAGAHSGSVTPPLENDHELETMKRRVLDTRKGERRRLAYGSGDRQRVYDVTVEPLSGTAGSAPGLCVCILDITDLVRTERRAREAEDHVENLLAISGAIIVVLDGEARIRSINRRGGDLLGIGIDKLIGLDWIANFIPVRQRPELRGVFAAIVDGPSGLSEYHENLIIGAGGQERLVAWRSTVLRDAGGRVSGVLSTGEDITESRRTSAALAESETRFRATFENAGVGIAHLDLDGGWLRVNRRLCSILGYDREELIGLRVQDITNADDIEADLQYTRRLLAGDVSNYTTEKRFILKDGGLVWVSVTASLVRRPDGSPEYVIMIVSDISARREADARARELAVVVENSSDFTGVAEPDGTVVYLNRAGQELVGLRAGETSYASPVEDFLVQEERAYWRERVLPALIGDGHWAGEFRLRHRQTDEAIPVHCSMHRISDSDSGRPLKLVMVACDLRHDQKAR